MIAYPKIRNILEAIFSIETGLSDDAQSAMLQRSLRNPEWRIAFQNELLSAATNPQTSWQELLSNDKYEVTDTDSELDARAIAMSLLWKTTFPDEPIPQL
ncbi:hypothetical protein [Fimbriiglobus ruber]|uniref:hypothetical protein n=1 Tax=Fimbriiglobus ruber TaxID=1908690 RepID=UPI001179D952|nr:hypothetical protein [Fimbriiglobus ruber]